MPIRTPFPLRHRRAVLASAVVFFGAACTVRLIGIGDGLSSPFRLLVRGSMVAILPMTVVGLLWWRRWRRPASFTVSPAGHAFLVPVSPDAVWTVAWQIGLMAIVVGGVLSSGPAEYVLLGLLELAICAAIGLAVLVMFVPAWRGTNVELRPEGLVERVPFGTLRVPWEALRPGLPVRPPPDATVLPLAYDRPDLVRWRGIGRTRRAVRADHVHPWFLADAIRFYVDHPEQRAGIGTVEGHDRLLRALGALGPADPGLGVLPVTPAG